MPERQKQPNILFITSDQHRADAMGCYGHPCVQTPHLDQLAYEGIRFDNAYSDCPVCIPARTTMITGIQSHIYGKPAYAEKYRIDRDRKDFLGSLVTAADYHSCLVGKTHWHTPTTFRAGFEQVVWMSNMRKQELLETGRSFNPTGIGFNEITPTLSKTPAHLHSTDWIVDRCIDFLETREREQPFFLWASFQDPHPPLTIHEPYYSMYDDAEIPNPVVSEWSQDPDQCPYAHYLSQWQMKTHLMGEAQLRKARSVYYGMITNLDHQLGRLFGKIMNDGDWDNTLIVYTSDHGDFLGDHGTAKKSSFCEAAAHIPLIIRPPQWMDVEPGRESTALVEQADLLPTFCSLAGISSPAGITGRSLLPLIDGSANTVREELHGNINGTHMLHDGRYKYMYWTEDGRELLIDTANDRNDTTPIMGPKLEEMRKRLLEHLQAEGHEHAAGGVLLNRQLEKPPINRARARDGAGLNPVATLSNIAQRGVHVH